MAEKNYTEKILNLFKTGEETLNLNRISKDLGINAQSNDYDHLKTALDDLAEQNILVKHTRRRFSLNDFQESSTIEGNITMHKGVGILETDHPEYPEIIVKRRNLNTALEGDRVLVKMLAMKKNKKPRGEVIKILDRNKNSIVGTIECDDEFCFLVPDEENVYFDFLIPHKKLNGADDGDKVSAKFLRWDDPAKNPLAEVIEILGKAGDPTVEFESILKEFGLPEEFPEQVEKESKKMNLDITPREVGDRLDLRNEVIVTIDPKDARDFDDALSVKELENGNSLLGVHIADVSHYVTEDSEIDIEARFRGTSTYLVDRVVPMIPEKLSNYICSLRPDEDRLAHTVFIELTKRGVPKNYSIKRTVINSKRRYTYEEVQDIIDGGDDKFKDLILKLYKLSLALRKRRFRKGGIDFKTFEVRYELGEDNYPVNANLKEATPATQLVEECMLAANQIVAGHVKEMAKKWSKRTLPYLFRIHDEPDPQQLKDALAFVRTLGVNVSKKKKITSRDLNEILHQIENKKEKFIIHQILIRAMAKAIYSTKNPGHYGLGFSEYTHFTSPIRRYPDLMVHRLIKEYEMTNPKKERITYLKRLLRDVSKQSSERERLAIDAERMSVRLAGAMMARLHVGEEFEGTISGVTSFGLFVMLDDIFAEGLVHIKDLTDDYYIYDEKNFCLIGKRRKKKFGFGQRVSVKIASANLEKRRIDLEYLENGK